MSVLAGCGHKSEWICRDCGSCSLCCKCENETFAAVHINTKDAAIALARWAKKKRAEYDQRAKTEEEPKY